MAVVALIGFAILIETVVVLIEAVLVPTVIVIVPVVAEALVEFVEAVPAVFDSIWVVGVEEFVIVEWV